MYCTVSFDEGILSGSKDPNQDIEYTKKKEKYIVSNAEKHLN